MFGWLRRKREPRCHCWPELTPIRNLNFNHTRSPKVGDEVIYRSGKSNTRRFLAIRIGTEKDNHHPGELWLAWTPDGGTLATVSVGYWWVLKEEDRP